MMQFYCEGALVGFVTGLQSNDYQHLAGFDAHYRLLPKKRFLTASLSEVRRAGCEQWVKDFNIPDDSEASIDVEREMNIPGAGIS